jgi:hypothetical protein
LNRFIREKLAESRARHQEYGGSVYLLEPDVKEGQGGLRDIQTARWIARTKLKNKDLDALATNGIVSAADVAHLKESQDFLLRVRNELHFSTGKHQDQLTFEHQEKVSAALGFEGEGSLRAVECSCALITARGAGESSLIAGHSPLTSVKSRCLAQYVFANLTRRHSHFGHVTVTKPGAQTSRRIS